MELLPNITQYWDYRQFLTDFYVHKKETKREFSYKMFCNKAEISSPSHFKMIIDGSRNLTAKSLPKYLKGLGFETKAEEKFFEKLVEYNQEKDVEKKSHLFEALLKLKSKKGLCPLEFYQFDFLANWYNVAIYVMMDLEDFKSDIDWISNRLKKRISKEHILSSLNTLTKLGLIKKDELGNFVQSNGALSTPDEIRTLAVRHYHRDMLQLAMTSLDEDDLKTREFNGATVPVAKENLSAMKEKIRQFRKEMNELATNLDSKDEIYQLNIQFFPLTKSRLQ